MQEVLEVIKNLLEAGTFHSGGVAKLQLLRISLYPRIRMRKKQYKLNRQEPIDEKGLGKA